MACPELHSRDSHSSAAILRHTVICGAQWDKYMNSTAVTTYETEDGKVLAARNGTERRNWQIWSALLMLRRGCGSSPHALTYALDCMVGAKSTLLMGAIHRIGGYFLVPRPLGSKHSEANTSGSIFMLQYWPAATLQRMRVTLRRSDVNPSGVWYITSSSSPFASPPLFPFISHSLCHIITPPVHCCFVCQPKTTDGNGEFLPLDHAFPYNRS